MIDALTSAQIAMNQDKLQLIAVNQNISNMHTPGYQRSITTNTSFDALLKPSQNNVAQTINTTPLQRQGVLDNTGRSLDFAIRGEGYFAVQFADGPRYTRRGDFHLNARGELVTHDNRLVLGKGGSIHLEGSDVRVKSDGTIYQHNRATTQLDVVSLPKNARLRSEGAGYFASDLPAEDKHQQVDIKQGFLEQSSVKSVDEMIEMTRIARHFQSSQRIMRSADELLSQAISQLGEG